MMMLSNLTFFGGDCAVGWSVDLNEVGRVSKGKGRYLPTNSNAAFEYKLEGFQP